MSRAAHTLLTDLATGQTMAVKLALSVVDGPDRGRRKVIGAGTVVVGGGQDVDVVLKDPRVSRRHASFELVADGVRVRDLGSKNGTRLDGTRVVDGVARPGSLVELGDTAIVVVADGERLDVGRGVDELGGLRAHGAAMRRVLGVLERAAKSDVTVLLLGESGVGKDVAARAIHAASPRAAGPFRVVDCGSISPGLIASELFGHKRGAFTSANEDRVGAFEAARGGTLFLDEIGELPRDLQPTLLRVLESRTATRVGDTAARPVDVRIVAATNRELSAEVARGAFRQDLFFRLAVVCLTIPPLRERRDEILAIAARILKEQGRSLDDVAPDERRRLLDHPWPGNVRELKNVLLRACALSSLDEPVRLALERPGSASGAIAAAESADDGALIEKPLSAARADALFRFESRYLTALMTACDGNVSEAARRARVARSYLNRLLVAHPEARPRRGRGR